MQVVMTHCASIALKAAALVALAATAAIAATEKTNVLFIAVDDLRPELGCYGETWMKTPNIDRLAASGVRFARHYVQAPTCGASRHSLLTGLRPRDPIEYGNGPFHKEESRERLAARSIESFPHLFKQNGYDTVAIGKISHDKYNSAHCLPRSWSQVVNPSRNPGFLSEWDFPDPLPIPKNPKRKRMSLRYPCASRDDDDLSYADGHLAKAAVETLRELKGKKQPFFLGVGFIKPHLPFSAPKKYWDLYDPQKIPAIPVPKVPEGLDRELSLHPNFELVSQYWVPKGALEGDQYRRKLRHGYCAAVSYMDAQLGKVLDELDRLGLAKNTIVVLWGDHGWHLGDHDTWGKHTAFEKALRSPLIVRTPHMNTAGQASDALIETVDIYPTLAELCDLAAPEGLDGDSFTSLLKDPKATGPTEAFSYHHPWAWSVKKRGPKPYCKAMRTDQYRLNVWTEEMNKGKVIEVELYDHRNDPEEAKNIADQRPELVRTLLKRMSNDGIPWNGILGD